jgi:hypothetical protein
MEVNGGGSLRPAYPARGKQGDRSECRGFSRSGSASGNQVQGCHFALLVLAFGHGQTHADRSRSAASGRSYLDGQFLIAMPGMADERFARSVVYICAHSSEGAMA